MENAITSIAWLSQRKIRIFGQARKNKIIFKNSAFYLDVE